MTNEQLFERTIEIDPAIGPLRLIATRTALVAVYFAGHRRPRALSTQVLDAPLPHPILDRAARELEEYAHGTRTAFTVPLAPQGTEFQRAVWSALTEIPAGETRSYSDLARAIDRPRAVRAVGAANALNPLSILVPCHRVIGKDGSLTGYAGGIERKQWLIAHERGARAASQC
jgi:methylated-DNA-[protein]-cysteine S-methyltransferase